MTPEQLQLIKNTLQQVIPGEGEWLQEAVQVDIYKSLNAINRELRELRKTKEPDVGLNLLKRSCSSSPYAVSDSNPDPKVFKIMNEKLYKGYLILLVNYPNCTNFEGKKLMVYEGFKSSAELIAFNNGKLDPHFSNGKGSPIARFKPRQTSAALIEAMINAIQIQSK